MQVANPWFSGDAAIPTYSREEMLATKLRALLQRDKGRDLYDLAQALEVFEGLDANRIVEMFGRYLDLSAQAVPAWKLRRSAMKPTSACVNIRSCTYDAIRAMRPA